MAHSCLASLRACEAWEVTAPDHLDQSISGLSCWDIESLLESILNALAKRPYQIREMNNLQLFGLLKSMRSPGGDSARPFGPVDFGLVLLGYRILAGKCIKRISKEA